MPTRSVVLLIAGNLYGSKAKLQAVLTQAALALQCFWWAWMAVLMRRAHGLEGMDDQAISALLPVLMTQSLADPACVLVRYQCLDKLLTKKPLSLS